MRLQRIRNLTIGLIILLAAAACQSRPSAVNPELRKRAVEELQRVMEQQESWVKVHAAEYKLWLDYTDGVQEAFRQEEKEWGERPPYRIGVWRVLAQSDLPSRESYVNNIIRAFEDRDGPDRIHAAETLAKLGVSVADAAPEITREVLEGPVNSLYVYTLWSMLQGADPDGAREKLLELALDSGRDEILRLQAAFALRNEGAFSESTWERLAMTGLQDQQGSLPRVYLLSAALIHAPEEKRNNPVFDKVKTALLELKDAPSKGARMEMAYALGNAGNPEDLWVLTELLENKNPILPEGEQTTSGTTEAINADVRAAAAYGILMLDRRQVYHLSWADWLVVVAYLAGMVGVGYYFSRKNKSEKDYYLGAAR